MRNYTLVKFDTVSKKTNKITFVLIENTIRDQSKNLKHKIINWNLEYK